MNGEKKEERKDFFILEWSGENIGIHNLTLESVIRSEVPSAKTNVLHLSDLKNMGISDLKRFMEDNSEKSMLIVSSSDEAKNMDYWRLGFIMGNVSAHGKKGKARIIGFVKNGQNHCLQKLSNILSKCKNEEEIKAEIKSIMKDMGYWVEYNENDYKAGKRVAEQKTKTFSIDAILNGYTAGKRVAEKEES